MKQTLTLARGIPQQLHTVLLYGTGNLQALEDLLTLNAKQYVLVEYDPKAFSRLEKMRAVLTDGAANIYCYNCAIDDNSEASNLTLYQASQLGFSSVNPPELIKQYRPGLRFIETNVPVKRLSYFVEQYDVSSKQQNMLLCDGNGGENALVDQVTDSNFSIAIYRASNKALYRNQGNLLSSMNRPGFFSLIELQEPHPPMCNVIQQKYAGMKAQQEELICVKQHLETIECQKETLKTKFATLNIENKDLKSSLVQLTESQSQTKEKQAFLTLQLEQKSAKNVELTKQLEEIKYLLSTKLAASTELEQQLGVKDDSLKHSEESFKKLKNRYQQIEVSLSRVIEERDRQKQYHLDNKNWAEGLDKSNKALKVSLEDLELKLKRLEEDNKSLVNELTAAQKNVNHCTTTMELNTKLMMKMQVDTEHLREQFQEKTESVADLQSLVAELHQKLQQAATFYHKLEQEYPELLAENSK
ncbi:MAG: hypothetical protein ABJJ44_06075 [Paraglaciecola sp.]|uniref:hypothetical protein n=1 Tax=Paraglaciecola sp. TaxID=1920173 RepID=UPI0032982F80